MRKSHFSGIRKCKLSHRQKLSKQCAFFARGMAVTALCLALTGCSEDVSSKVEMARNEGLSYMESGDYQSAITSFENAYGLCDEKMPETKTDIGLYEATCQYQLEDYEGTKDTCSKILALNDNVDAYYLRGASFLKLGEDDAAKADFDAAASLAPTDYAMLFNIYKQYEAVNRSAIGDTYLQQALNIEGEEMDDYYEKGCIYFYLKNYDQAQEMLLKPVEAKHKEAMMLMGQVYLAQDDSTHARTIYQQYIDEYGEDIAAYNGIVLCEIADGNYSTAITQAETGIALEGTDEEKRDLHFNEIVAYEKEYDFESAKAKAEEFVQLYPNDEEGQKEYEFLITR